jgi:hypothetical protein
VFGLGVVGLAVTTEQLDTHLACNLISCAVTSRSTFDSLSVLSSVCSCHAHTIATTQIC